MGARNIEHLAKADPIMHGLVARLAPFTLKPRRLAPFRSLVQAIIYQQLSGKAAAAILARFEALFPHSKFPSPEEVLSLSSAQLCAAGLSRPKASYILGLAEHTAAGHLPTLAACDRLTDAEIIERFTEVKGVGRWTAEMFLVFNLGRPDVLPVHDLGVRKGFQIAYGKRKLPEPERLEAFGQKWSPHRTTATWYLWRVLDAL